MTRLHFTAKEVAKINAIALTQKCLNALAKDGKELSDTATMYIVRPAGSDDCWHENYVGITTQPVDQRWKQHRAAIKKGGDEKKAWPNEPVEYFQFLELDLTDDQRNLEFVLKAEAYLRPKRNTGWNISKGGDWSFSRRSDDAWWNGVMPVIRYKLKSDTYVAQFTVYLDDGTQKLLAAYSPKGMGREEAAAGLTAIHQMLLADYQKLGVDDAPNIDQINNENLRAAKRQLGWAVFDGFKGSYVFADNDTGAILHADGIAQIEATRRFGISRPHIHLLRDTLLGKPKMQKFQGKLYPFYRHTLKYNHGVARLAGVFDATTNQWTFHKDTTDAQRAEILKANSGMYSTEPLVTWLVG